MHGDDYLSDADCIKLRLGMMCSLSAYWWLRFDHMLHNPPTQSNLKVWKPKPKQHQWCHLVELFIIPTRINPRKTNQASARSYHTASVYSNQDSYNSFSKKATKSRAEREKNSLKTPSRHKRQHSLLPTLTTLAPRTLALSDTCR